MFRRCPLKRWMILSWFELIWGFCSTKWRIHGKCDVNAEVWLGSTRSHWPLASCNSTSANWFKYGIYVKWARASCYNVTFQWVALMQAQSPQSEAVSTRSLISPLTLTSLLWEEEKAADKKCENRLLTQWSRHRAQLLHHCIPGEDTEMNSIANYFINK